MNWLGNQMYKGLEYMIIKIMNTFVHWGIQVLNSVLISPFNLNAIPGYTPLLAWLTGASFAWLSVVIAKEFLMNMMEFQNDVHPLTIIKNAVTSGVLITASPMIVTGIILPVMQMILNEIENVFAGGNLPALTNNLESHIMLSTGSTATGMVLAGVQLGTDGIWFALAILAVMLFTFFWVSFASGMRWIELIFLALIGPTLALSKASYSNSWDIWLRETISVALSQVIQAFSMLLGMTLILNPISVMHAGSNIYMDLFISIGSFIFAIRGPKTLRTILGAPPNGLKAMQSMAGNIAKVSTL